MQNIKDIKRFLKSVKMINDARTGNYIFYDKKNDKIFDYNISAFQRILTRRDWIEYMNKYSELHEFVYEPRQQRFGVNYFNLYRLSKWRKNTKLQLNEIPKVYRNFFLHLVNNDIGSYHYLLDWLANSLHRKNFTILCAIGDEGIGKGTLAEIIELLHGEENFIKTRDSVLKKDFNAQISNKTFVYIDEVKLTKKEQMDRLKDLVNIRIEIEKKGYDTTSEYNHASIYLSSNDLNAIKPSHSDRRFSILEMTDIPLKDTPLIKTRDALLDIQNITQLGRYLEQLEIISDMLTPWKGFRAEEIKEANLTSWEDWLINEYIPRNKSNNILTIDWKTVQTDIDTTCCVKPGRRKIEECIKQYPKVAKFKQNGTKRWIVIN